MSAPDPRSPAEHRRPRSEPVEMSAAEKLACEWEARHDVVARRRVTAAAPVQDYLAHSRSGGARPAADQTAARPHASPRAHTHAPDAASTLRSWLRWGEDGGPGNPVIPRC